MKVKLTLASNMSVAVTVTIVSPGITAVSVKSLPSTLAVATETSEDSATSDNISSGSRFASSKASANDNTTGS